MTIGAKLAAPDRPVIGIGGDGGLDAGQSQQQPKYERAHAKHRLFHGLPLAA